MNQQTAFELYEILVVGIFAQSVLAWELGSKGVQLIINETNRDGRPSVRILGPFALFLVGAIWQRVGNVTSSYQSWRNAWPVAIALIVFVIGRSRRPR